MSDSEGSMMIISAPCWQCEKETQIALVGDASGGLGYGPESFSESEKRLAEQHGVLLKIVSSKTAEETYLANACKECGEFVGKWFFFAHYYTPALYGRLKYKRVPSVAPDNQA